MRDSHVSRTGDERGLKRAAWIGGGLVLLVLVAGFGTRFFDNRELSHWTAEQAIPTVATIRPTANNGATSLVLPASVEAWAQAPVYARTNGYLRRWHADIGSKVKAGQLLAEIDAPELDQQLAAARAELATAEANRKLAASTATRWDKLVAEDAVSRQEAEEKRGDLAARTAMANAARAEVDRLKALSGFKRITAPFDGVVTSRATDVGALIVAGNAAATPLFTVSDTRRMRIYVRVPQSYSVSIHKGMTAQIEVPEYPGKTISAELERSAGAVDPASGTVLVQLVANNAEGLLKPGAYAQVHFDLPEGDGGIRIPASALMFNKNGMRVALAGPGGRVTTKPVDIAQDLGTEVVIATGLSTSDRVIDSPPDALTDGDTVHVLKKDGGQQKGKAGNARG